MAAQRMNVPMRMIGPMSSANCLQHSSDHLYEQLEYQLSAAFIRPLVRSARVPTVRSIHPTTCTINASIHCLQHSSDHLYEQREFPLPAALIRPLVRATRVPTVWSIHPTTCTINASIQCLQHSSEHLYEQREYQLSAVFIRPLVRATRAPIVCSMHPTTSSSNASTHCLQHSSDNLYEQREYPLEARSGPRGAGVVRETQEWPLQVFEWPQGGPARRGKGDRQGPFFLIFQKSVWLPACVSFKRVVLPGFVHMTVQLIHIHNSVQLSVPLDHVVLKHWS